MAPKKPTVTSSSTRSARAKTGSNPVVTKGEARTRAARTTLGPAPKQRPLATGGTKGPLQGGTRTATAAKPSGQFKAPSVPKPGTATKPQGTPQAQAWLNQNKPSARLRKQMNAQQLANLNKVRQGLAPVASLLGGLRNVAFNAIKDVVTPRSFADSTLSAQAPKIAKQLENMKPSASKGAKPAAGTSRFAGARDEAFAKAKAIKGSPVVGPKPASAPARMSAPAARSSAPSAPRAAAPKASAPKASAPKSAGPVRMSASTYNRVSGNYGTSRSNNPLMADFKNSLPSKAADPDVGYSPKTKVSSKNIKGAPTDVTKLAFSNPKLSAERTRKIKRG